MRAGIAEATFADRAALVQSAVMTNDADETASADTQADSQPIEDTQPIAAPASAEVLHVRVGGQPGVRVTAGGEVQHKRVKSAAVDMQNDMRQIPIPVLAEVRAILDGETELSPGEARAAVRDLLRPWL